MSTSDEDGLGPDGVATQDESSSDLVEVDQLELDRRRGYSRVPWLSEPPDVRERRMSEARARVRAGRLAQGLPARIPEAQLIELARIAYLE